MKLKCIHGLNEKQMYEVYDEVERFWIECEARDEFDIRIERLPLTDEHKNKIREIYDKEYSEKISREAQTNIRKYDEDRVFSIESALDEIFEPKKEEIIKRTEKF